jgi:hypothetical protein
LIKPILSQRTLTLAPLHGKAGENYIKTAAEKLLTPRTFSGALKRDVAQLDINKIVQQGLHALTGRVGQHETSLRLAILIGSRQAVLSSRWR